MILTVSNADPVKTISGKRLILFLAVGLVLFTAVMGFGTYGLAKWIGPMLEHRRSHSAPVK